MLQSLLVAVIVVAAFGYAAWTLIPALRRRFGRPGSAAGSCGGCGSCAATPVAGPTGAPREQPIRIVRMPEGAQRRADR